MTTAAIPLSGTRTVEIHPKSLRSNFARVTVGFSVYAACQWAIMAVLAKLGSPELVGQYAFALALTAPVLMLAQMNLRTVLATDVKGVHDFSDYRSLRFISLLAAMFLILILAAREGVDPSRSVVIALVGLIQAGEFMADICYGQLQLQDRMQQIAISMIARGLLGVLALGSALWATGSLAVALIWMFLARLAVYLAYDARNVIHDSPARAEHRPWSEQAKAQRAILKQALPLGVVLMLGALVVNTPRYFIASSLGERELGVFSAIFSLAAAGNLIVNSLGQSATPKLARLHASGDKRGFLLLSLKMAALGAGLGLLGIAGAATIGSSVVAAVYRPEYAQQNGLLVVAMAACGVGFVASLLGYCITAARRLYQQIPLQVACLAGTALAAWCFIPRWGLVGAALAPGVGALVQLAAESLILRSVVSGLAAGERS